MSGRIISSYLGEGVEISVNWATTYFAVFMGDHKVSPGGSDGKVSVGRPGFDPWVRKTPWRREWLLTPVFLSGEFHAQRSLAGCSPRRLQRVRHDWFKLLLIIFGNLFKVSWSQLYKVGHRDNEIKFEVSLFRLQLLNFHVKFFQSRYHIRWYTIYSIMSFCI